MQSYLFIASRDPFASRDVESAYRLIAELATRGTPVTLFLVQNGVLAARREADVEQFAALMTTPGVAVLVDTFALQERGITPDTLTPGVQTANIETLVDLLIADGQKAIWH
jgi:sulfur relay (sulfurtransferase) complex TusBCD TusD component (DsrE family)